MFVKFSATYFLSKSHDATDLKNYFPLTLNYCVSGIPKGVINVVTSGRSNAAAIGNILCTSPDVAGLSFTGMLPQ